MPYIKQDQRDHINKELTNLIIAMKDLHGFVPGNQAGVLNYIITKLCKSILDDRLNYSQINELIGALECSKLELYRRVSYYEDKKIIENGDV